MSAEPIGLMSGRRAVKANKNEVQVDKGGYRCFETGRIMPVPTPGCLDARTPEGPYVRTRRLPKVTILLSHQRRAPAHHWRKPRALDVAPTEDDSDIPVRHPLAFLQESGKGGRSRTLRNLGRVIEV